MTRINNHSTFNAFCTSLAACRLMLAVLFLTMLGGCVPPEQEFIAPLADFGRDANHTARISCFLTLKDDQGPAIRMEIANLEVFDGDNWLPVSSGPIQLDSLVLGTSQLFLGGRAVPPGRYHRLRLTITTGEVQKADGKYGVMVQTPFAMEINFVADLALEKEDSGSLLITWDVKNSLRADNTLQPALMVAPPLRQMLLDLLFVACPDIDTIFVVRADKNWVVDSFGLKGRPTYLALDPDTSGQRLYVLASGDRMIKVIDLASYRVIDFFPVPLNDVATFMTISPDGQGAFLLDERNGYLSRIDLTSGRSIARVQLGYGPTYAIYLNDQNLLAVSLSLSQKVLLLDPMSLAEVGTIFTGSMPEGLAVSDNQLYIAEYGDNAVSVTDLTNTGNQSRVEVGFGPRRLLDTGNQIYVSNYKDDSLSVLVPGQFGVSQEIFGLGRPQEMAFDQFYRRLYVTDEDAAALDVINVNANMVLGHISLGAKPVGLAIIQQ
jgi:DNA-binding beta-propeller fold protein YncE